MMHMVGVEGLVRKCGIFIKIPMADAVLAIPSRAFHRFYLTLMILIEKERDKQMSKADLNEFYYCEWGKLNIPGSKRKYTKVEIKRKDTKAVVETFGVDTPHKKSPRSAIADVATMKLAKLPRPPENWKSKK